MPASKNLSLAEMQVYSRIKKLNERARVIYKEYGANSTEYLQYKKSIEGSFDPSIVKISRSGAISVKQSQQSIQHIMAKQSEAAGLTRSLQLRQKRDYKNKIKKMIFDEEGIKKPTKAKIQEYEDMIRNIKEYSEKNASSYSPEPVDDPEDETYEDYQRYADLMYHKGRKPTYNELNEAIEILKKHEEEWEKVKYGPSLTRAVEKYTMI